MKTFSEFIAENSGHILEKIISNWAKENNINRDSYTFYSPKDWMLIDGNSNLNSELILFAVPNKDMAIILNNDLSPINTSLNELLQTYGYYYELGNKSEAGIYKI